MVCQIKVREKRDKPPSDVPDCRYFAGPLPIWDASAAKFRQADFDRQNVALLTPGAGLIYGLAGLIRGISTVCGFMRPVVWRFRVVKTTQSRERTERTLPKALSQLLWP